MKIQKKDLSDLDIESLPDGFAIIFEGDRPVASIAKIEYYHYIISLLKKVREYIAQTKDNR